VQATAAGGAVALGGILRDVTTLITGSGWLGDVLASPTTGYLVVYYLEIVLLAAVLIALIPLLRAGEPPQAVESSDKFGMVDFPST
jgi:BCD family chlorophyll transporter-like MFS transporter